MRTDADIRASFDTIRDVLEKFEATEDILRIIAILALGGPSQLAEYACQNMVSRQAHRDDCLVRRARRGLEALATNPIFAVGVLRDMIRIIESDL